jgi:two-component system sensor histidine kinase ChvG
MALDTAIKKTKRALLKKRRFRLPRIGGGLTLRILSVNLIAPVILAAGLLYLGQYRDSLIAAELKTLTLQSQLFAGAIAEGAVRPVQRGKPLFFARPEEIEMLIPELSRRMLRRLGETMDTRTQLFDTTGQLIGDSDEAARAGQLAELNFMGPLKPKNTSNIKGIGETLLRLMPMQSNLPTYPETISDQVGDYPDAALAIKGTIAATAWENKQGQLILTASAPVQKSRQKIGVVLLSRDGKDIKEAVDQMRFDILTIFMGALSITIFLSMYLAGFIGQPLKKLARAAEAVRMGQGRQIDIPDLTHRRDEIGELSAALRDMTRALWDRMDTIERFAADVSHEIKNPLTSLRSAVETAFLVKGREADLERLLHIMQHDVTRLDRLISDISNASRLDAELSREEMGSFDPASLLKPLVDAHRLTLERQQGKMEPDPTRLPPEQKLLLILPEDMPGKANLVRGNEHRLAQVFENLLTNALSFSPPAGAVILEVKPEPHNQRTIFTVSDEGPGIPDNKLENIFERFYSQRPKHEGYGRHSGLGLSIARQIIKAHGGVIYAENIRNQDGSVKGARFTVVLNNADAKPAK